MNLFSSVFRKRTFYLVFLLSLFPFLALIFDNSVFEEPIPKFANIFGYIGALILFWQFFLGIRGVVKRLTSDYDWSIKIHTYLGIYGSILVFLHPLLLMIHKETGFQAILLLNFSNEYQSYVSFGKLALYFFIILWITSSIARKSLSYRSWLYIHYISYPMIFFVLLHPLKIGSYLQEYSFVYFYWIFLCLSMFIFTILKLFDIFNLSFVKYKVIAINNFPGETFSILYEPVNNYFRKIKPGQYFYIKTSKLSEAHPFSILEYDELDNKLKFGIKKFGKFSNFLANSKVGDIHYLDGPFGEFTLEGQNGSPKVILAGGIGITPFYELIQQFGNDDTYLFYANKNLSSAFYRDEFKKLLKNNYFDFIEQPDGKKDNVFCELISANKIKALLSNREIENINYFICGSPGFTKSMISCLSSLGISRSKIFIEEFEY